MICTMQGDVWRVEGLDAALQNVRWRRYRLGPAPGARPGRRGGQGPRPGPRPDHPASTTSTATARPTSTNASATLRDLARGPRLHLRAPARRLGPLLHRLGQAGDPADLGRRQVRRGPGDRVPQPRRPGPRPDGTITVPCSEGEWTPASMVCEIKPGRPLRLHGTRNGQPPDLPLVYLPRGLDNSSGGQVTVPDDRLGPLEGQMMHLSFGAGSAFPGAPREGRRPAARGGRAAAGRVPLGRPPGPVQSQGRPALRLGHDRLGHLHVRRRLLPARPLHGRAGSAPGRIPRARERRARDASPDRSIGDRREPPPPFRPGLELSLQPGIRLAGALAEPSRRARPRPAGHPLGARPGRRPHACSSRSPSCSRSTSSTSTFAPTADARSTCSRRSTAGASPFTGLPGYVPQPKTIAAHPILADMAALTHQAGAEPLADQASREPGSVTIEAGKNLSYTVRSFKVRPASRSS